jgi:Anti-sigma factor NepR
MAVSRDKEHSVSGKIPSDEQQIPCEPDRIAVVLRDLYGRIAAEPLPRRLVELLVRLRRRE